MMSYCINDALVSHILHFSRQLHFSNCFCFAKNKSWILFFLNLLAGSVSSDLDEMIAYFSRGKTYSSTKETEAIGKLEVNLGTVGLVVVCMFCTNFVFIVYMYKLIRSWILYVILYFVAVGHAH